MRFSLIIPLHRDSAAFRQCLQHCRALAHPNYEIIVVSDRVVALPDDPRLKLVVTGGATDTSPALKRDVGASHATGDALAYIDDDAYPESRWLSVAEAALGEPGTEAIGGPGVTPPGSPVWCRAGGRVYSSLLGSGPLRYRFTPQSARVVDDYPAYNLIVRADAVRRVGGWASDFYGGEDTRFCERLAEAGVLIHYRPDLLVYHHRRALFRPHMRQIANVGRHRGYFARVHPETSRRVMYFAPLAALVILAAGVAVMLALVGVWATLVIAALAYLAAALTAGGGTPAERALFPLGVVAHHTSYGLAFARGLMTKNMDR